MTNGRFSKPPFWQHERFLLIAAVSALSLMTVIVGVALYFFVASVQLAWQAPAAIVEAAPDLLAVSIEGDAIDAATDRSGSGKAAVVPTPVMVEETAVPSQIASAPVSQSSGQPLDRDMLLSGEIRETAVPSLAYLIIPSLGVTQTIDAVPLINGQWDISGLSTQVGLLDSTGTHPGDAYAMTFIGHVTVPWPGTGPFADLILLEHGEEVIYRFGGTDYVYQVERIFRATPDAVDLLYVPDGEKIVLVTCSGWDFVDREYDERLVTRAVLVRTEPSPS